MCLKPGCQLCAPLHASHDVIKIEKAYEDQISKLYQVMATTDKDIEFLNDNRKNICKKILPANLEYYNENKLRIKEREKKLRKMVSNEAKTLIRELDENYALKERELLDQREKFTSKIDVIKQRKTYDHDDIDIYDTTLMKSLPDGTVIVLEYSTLRYMYFRDSDVVHIDTKIFENLPIEDMTVCENGDILFTISDGSSASANPSDIMCVRANGQIEKITTIEPQVILRGIHATSHNIFVGYERPELRYGGSDIEYESQDKPVLSVLILDMQGNVIVTLKEPGIKREITNDGEQSYDDEAVPWKLTTNINGDILIISGDCCESNEGKVVALDRKGQFKWVYFGVESFYFGPSHIQTTSNGLILVLNWSDDDDSIHVISMEGEFLTKFGVEEGINNPRCLHIDQNDQLYIACCKDDRLVIKLCLLNSLIKE
ncbi:unnamed protein product [Mytilus edulis]|uniref:Uncharacterized protein n=1 Tax=Mytilus edulis TaxID=6550 RepID=A0A8S3U840_MYTED|nr:unnamed protein product [Mytilus edulis]